MSTDWKPSEGLLLAEDAVRHIQGSADSASIHDVRSPVLRHRMVEVVAAAIDAALTAARIQPSAPVPVVHTRAAANGGEAPHAPAAPTRGRPPGSRNKKAKRGKKKPVEMEISDAAKAS